MEKVDAELKSGDVVILKSGGPRLTISYIGPNSPTQPKIATLHYFIGDVLQTIKLRVETLIKVAENQ